MDTIEFAAQRAARLENADKEMFPFVEAALAHDVKLSKTWDDVVEAASVLWLEMFEREANGKPPSALVEELLGRFQESLRDSLRKTSTPSKPPVRAEIDRVVMWVGTVTVNDATWSAITFATNQRTVRWVTMHDSAVREMHRVVDGQVRRTDGTFDVGGHRLRYPGEPVGPPEVWINCRCLIAPGTVRRSLSMTDTMAVATEPAEEVVETDLPDDPEEETDAVDAEALVDDMDEDVPWHAVLAPEGVPTGDGRMFALGSLSTRDLPLPITYQYESAEGHMKAVVVGRMDEAWRDEATNTYRARGVFWMSEPMAHKAIDGIAGGFLRGLSVDVDDIEVEASDLPEDIASAQELIDLMNEQSVQVFSRARISGAAIVHIPAFAEAFIGLGPDFEDESDVELTEEDLAALAACGCIDGYTFDPEDEDGNIELGYDAFRDVDAAERKRLADAGEALPDGSFPIANVEDLKNAIQAIGRAKDPEAAKAHIKKRARALGHEELIPEDWAGEVIVAAAFAPGTKDGPGWITHPRATARIRRYWVAGKGAAKIKWGAPGDFNRCRRQLAKYVQRPDWLAGLCANMHKEALGFWPAQHRPGGKHALVASGATAPMFTLVASGAVVDSSYFKNPELTEPVGVVIDGDRVYGYVATWGVCHIGIKDKCEQAPTSLSNYAYFRTGTVQTDEGPVAVGQITMGTGHAAMDGSYRVAAEHYDHTGSAVADIVTGEDTIGIWFSGKLRDDVTEEDRFALAAAGRLSGDWRWVGSGLEMVGALAVNVPGFPIPQAALVASAGEVTAVVAMGVVDVDEQPLVASALDAEMIASISRAAVEEYIFQMDRQKRLAALAPFREEARRAAITRLREKVTE